MDAMGATEQHDAPTTELVGGVVGDRCASCQAPLAPDQRYCVNCGERRGRPRFSYEALIAQAGPASSPASSERPASSAVGGRFSSATTLVAGVATLLIAMGVGVLIGHNSAGSAPVRASAPEVIRIAGGTGSPASGTAATSPGPVTPRGGNVGKVHVTHVVVAKAAKAANQAASKVLGKGGSLANNVNQSVGGSCSGGAGCQSGKFTGNFFPGG